MTFSQSDLDFFAETALAWSGECRDYHFVRAYQLAGGAQLGPATDGPVLADLLSRTLTTAGRVLIAGSADAGQLQYIHTTLGERANRIVVADRCETPLRVCRRYAAAAGFKVETAQVDFTRDLPAGPFDLIFAHIVTRFIPASSRVDFFRRLASVLSPGGHIVVVEMAGTRSGKYRDGIKDNVLSGLARQGMEVHYQAELLEALERISAIQPDSSRQVPDLASIVHEAGLAVECNVLAEVGTSPRKTGMRQYVLASNAGKLIEQ